MEGRYIKWLKIYLDKNVLETAFERLEFIFDNFDNICFFNKWW